MNYFLRGSQPVVPEMPAVPESEFQKSASQKPMTTLEGLIAEDSSFSGDSGSGNSVEFSVSDVSVEAIQSASRDLDLVRKHIDVLDGEGWITIPNRKLPDNWENTLNMEQLRALDRSFLIPGEQIHVLVILSQIKQDSESTTLSRAAAAMHRNVKSDQDGKSSRDDAQFFHSSMTLNGDVNVHGVRADQTVQEKGEISDRVKELKTESVMRLENHKQKIENVLETFRASNFFVRIADSDEPLWSKKNSYQSSQYIEENGRRSLHAERNADIVGSNDYNIVSDKGFFDGITSGGAARDAARCYALSNGDIVVLLRINVVAKHISNPVLEVRQFEKPRNYCEKLSGGLFERHDDPCNELLNWLIPLDRTLPPPRSMLPPLNPSMSHKQSLSSSGAQIFGHFRSYSMPSLPPNAAGGPPLPPNKPAFELEDFDNFAPQKPTPNSNVGIEGDLSFRGVPLEPDRYSVRCGLEGVYLPGRRWRRKVQIIQPIKVDSFSSECTTENLLCVLVKNVAPSHLQDLTIYIDSITIIYAEESKGGVPLALPFASIEAGNGNCLPNLALRVGEEHSFILKPAAMMQKCKSNGSESYPTNSKRTAVAPNLPSPSRVIEYGSVSTADQFAVLVSYRCNYTESKLFFKQMTSWRPCATTDLMISVSSEPYKHAVGPSARVPHLPVQVLTLEATNLTREDLTLTVLAPESLSSSPSVLSFNSALVQPDGIRDDVHSSAGRERWDRLKANMKRLTSISGGLSRERNGGASMLGSASGCTHLWLQSAVPLGCVPAQSSTTVKLELLPLTDGIITLDTLQIAIKEKGVTYTPEHSLEIFATSSALPAVH